MPKGFTFLELVAVLIILGAVSVYALSSASPEAGAHYDAAALRTHIRYAQAQSMNTGEVWGIDYASGSYSLFNDGSTSNVQRLPGEQDDSISASLGSSFILSFDSWGAPCSDAACNTKRTSDLSISVSKDGDSETVTVVRNTGYVR